MWRSLHTLVRKQGLVKPRFSGFLSGYAPLSSRDGLHSPATECHGMSNVRSTSDLIPSHAQQRTIYALSTPPGKAGIAVVRISGAEVLDVWGRMVWSKNKRGTEPEPWKMERCRIVHPDSLDILDDGLAVFFKGTCHISTRSQDKFDTKLQFLSPQVVHNGGCFRITYSFWSCHHFLRLGCPISFAFLSACGTRRVFTPCI
jgi:hypothetical protein